VNFSLISDLLFEFHHWLKEFPVESEFILMKVVDDCKFLSVVPKVYE